MTVKRNIISYFLFSVLFLLFFGWFTVQASLASGTLYSYGVGNTDGSHGVYTVDPTGITSLVGSGGLTNNGVTGNPAFDAAGQQYFFTGIDTSFTPTLFVVNTQTGQLTSNPITGDANPNSIGMLAFDNSTGTLYSYGVSNTDGSHGLYAIDPATGITHLVAGGLTNSGVTGNPAFDAAGQQYFFIGIDASFTPTLFTVNVTKKSLTSSPITGDANPNSVGMLAFDDSAGSLYSYGVSNTDGSHGLYAVDPTGITHLVAGGLTNSGVTGNPAFDSAGHRYFFTGIDASFTPTLFVVNAVYGTLTSSPLTGAANPNSIGMLAFDNGIANQPPVVSGISVSPNPVQINTQATATANFTDPDGDTHTGVWDWGDGSTGSAAVTEPNGSTPGSVSGTHVYANPGVYTVTLTITDSGGLTGTSQFQYVSVYNPTAQGLFSGGSKFSSPAGAYTANPSLTGDVKFGLSYKYQGTLPVGDKQFTMRFDAANITFNATSVSSLVIANGIGTLTGTGTINDGSQVYNFLVTGSETNNTIRVQITDASNNVIYDTQPGDAATTAPATSVSGHVLAH